MITVKHNGWLATVRGGEGVVKIYDPDRYLRATVKETCYSDEDVKKVVDRFLRRKKNEPGSKKGRR